MSDINMKQIIVTILMGLTLIFTVSSCTDHKTTTPTHEVDTITVTEKPTTTTLYYSGNIAPIHVTNITSPVEGHIIEKHFQYGKNIKKGDVLFVIQSQTLEKNYQSALSSFLTAKDKYNNAQQRIIGTEDLYKAGIISRNEYVTAKSSLYDSHLTYLQARQQLEDILLKAGLSEEKIEALRIGDRQAVEKALRAPVSHVIIKAAADGIVLIPPKSEGASGQTTTQQVEVGSEVKAGQTLVTIGEMSGISIELNVSELNINLIQPGQKTIVTSPAFPGITLHGVVTSVKAQAITQNTGGLPTFPVTVKIKNFPKQAQDLIHVGMSSKVAITIEQPPAMTIPISAVGKYQGQTVVKVFNPKTKQIKIVPVKTGTTDLDSVHIISGIKPGDHIVVHY